MSKAFTPAISFTHSDIGKTGSSSPTESSRSEASSAGNRPGVELWEGRSVFVKRTDDVGSVSHQGRQMDRAVSPVRKGTLDSPISIASTPSPIAIRHPTPEESLPRPRAVPSYSSPAARTAYTPIRARTIPFSESPSKQHDAGGTSRLQSGSPKGKQSHQMHPFFSRGFARTRSALIPPAPASHRPRMFADYSSTSASGSRNDSQGSRETGSTWGSQPNEPRTVAPIASTSKTSGRQEDGNQPVIGAGKGKGKLQEWEIDQIINQIGRVDLTGKFRENPWDGKEKTSKPSEAAGKSRSGDKTVQHRPPPDREKRPTVIPPFIATTSEPALLDSPSLIAPATQTSEDNRAHLAPSATSRRPITPPLPQTIPSDLPLFSYRNHPSRPSMAYTSDPSEANDLLSCLRGPVLGLDLEWPVAGKHTIIGPDGKPKQVNIGMTWDTTLNKWKFGQGRTALVQVCDERLIVLVHLKDMKALPTKVIEIMQDPKLFKTGVQVKGDGAKLLRDFPTSFPQGISGLLELSYIARTVDPVAVGPGNMLIGLAKQSKVYLNHELDKETSVRRSNWLSNLSDEQIEYAANDVYASLQIYLALQRLADERSIPINLPSCSHSITPDGQAYISSHQPETKPPKTAPQKGRIGSDGIAASSNPPAAQERALASFQTGLSTVEIADSSGIKETTVQAYILKALAMSPEVILDDLDKRRLVDAVPADTYAGKAYKKLLRRLREELGDESATDPPGSGDENEL